MGASPFGYKVAEQFDLKVWPTRAGLVPFTLQPDEKEKLSVLSGISIESIVSNARNTFHENILFTHRGLSGPSILQISSYWQSGEEIEINLLPGLNIFEKLLERQKNEPQKLLKSILSEWFPKRMIDVFFQEQILNIKLASISHQQFKDISTLIQKWVVKPNGTEGYRTAEVTLGGVDCDEISSKTMEVNSVKGLYFIGEVLDVSGWLGGYNFQWAWSSGWAAGQVV
jgi:predicted Rossmann fold flavoprotein